MGIDCVYSAKSRLGRPRGQGKDAKVVASSRREQHRALDNRTSPSETSSSVEDAIARELTVFSSPYEDFMTSIDPALQMDLSNDHEGTASAVMRTPSSLSSLYLNDNQGAKFGDTNKLHLQCKLLSFVGPASHVDCNPIADLSHWNFGTLGDVGSMNLEPNGEAFNSQSLQLEGKQSRTETYDELQAGSSNRILLHQEPYTTFAMSTSTTLCSSSAEDTESKANTLRQLLDLQSKLQYLLPSHFMPGCGSNDSTSGESDMSDDSALGEVLAATEGLIEILDNLSTRKDQISEANSRRHSRQTCGCHTRIPDALPSDSEDDGLVILQVLTCYLYLLRMFEPLAISLQRQSGSSATSTDASRPTRSSTTAFQLGSFSLASQPELNAKMTSNLIYQMIQRLHVSTQSIVSKDGSRHLESAGPEAIGCQKVCKEKVASPMMIAARVASGSISLKEHSVLHRLQSYA
jgi:hypothetical protein